MALIINIRGTNGSGKTTLARQFLPADYLQGSKEGGPVDLVRFNSPTMKDPARVGVVPGYGNNRWKSIVVGPYQAVTGGLDGVNTFARQQSAIRAALRILDGPVMRLLPSPVGAYPGAAIAEGVLASTVYGSWAEFADEMEGRGHKFAFTYLHTPLELCLQRIRQRQEASGKVREIKKELVADKVKAIFATRQKALTDGRLVLDLPPGGEIEAMKLILAGEWNRFRA